MESLLSSIKLTVVILAVCSAIPLIWWLLNHRKTTPFFQWIGLIEPHLEQKWWILMAVLTSYFFLNAFDLSKLLSPEALEYFPYTRSRNIAEAVRRIDPMKILCHYIMNFFGAAAGSEILFRGFLCKRLCCVLGTARGVWAQAILSAIISFSIFLILDGVSPVQLGIWYCAAGLSFNTARGLLLGYLNEKVFNRSILPSMGVAAVNSFLLSFF